tara:strand:+ start:19 stop:207 length:189 start_codon:yes stop_codon:yes gene_type:complete
MTQDPIHKVHEHFALSAFEKAFNEARELLKLGLISSEDFNRINEIIVECEFIIKDAIEEVEE